MTTKRSPVVCRHIDETQEMLATRMLLENPSTYVQLSTAQSPTSSSPKTSAAPAAACCSTSTMSSSARPTTARPVRLSRRVSASPRRRDPSRRLRRRGRRRRRAAADRRPQFAGARGGLVALPRDRPSTRPDADADRMGQRRSAMVGPGRRGAPRGNGNDARRRWERCAMPFKRRSPACARPDRPEPAGAGADATTRRPAGRAPLRRLPQQCRGRA